MKSIMLQLVFAFGLTVPAAFASGGFECKDVAGKNAISGGLSGDALSTFGKMSGKVDGKPFEMERTMVEQFKQYDSEFFILWSSEDGVRHYVFRTKRIKDTSTYKGTFSVESKLPSEPKRKKVKATCELLG